MFVLIRMLTHSTQILCKACFVVKKIDVRLLFGESLNDYKKECFDPQLCGGFIQMSDASSKRETAARRASVSFHNCLFILWFC